MVVNPWQRLQFLCMQHTSVPPQCLKRCGTTQDEADHADDGGGGLEIDINGEWVPVLPRPVRHLGVIHVCSQAYDHMQFQMLCIDDGW